MYINNIFYVFNKTNWIIQACNKNNVLLMRMLIHCYYKLINIV